MVTSTATTSTGAGTGSVRRVLAGLSILGLTVGAAVIVAPGAPAATTATCPLVAPSFDASPGHQSLLQPVAPGTTQQALSMFNQRSLAECPGVTVTMSRPDGSNVRGVRMTRTYTDHDGSAAGVWGDFATSLADVGTWVIRSVQNSTGSLSVNRTVIVPRGFGAKLDPVSIPPVAGPVNVAATGRMWTWTNSGRRIPLANYRVFISTDKGSPGSTLTQSNGEFRLVFPLQSGTRSFGAFIHETTTMRMYEGCGANDNASNPAAPGYASCHNLLIQPTLLSGSVAPNSTGPYYGSLMKVIGTLKVRYTTGAIGPYANQPVLVQVRGPGESAYSTVATGTGNSRGVFTAYYTQAYRRGSRVDVRLAFAPRAQTIGRSYAYLRAFTIG